MHIMALVVYDNGGKTIDRYTVFPNAHSRDSSERRFHLSLSEGGKSVSMWDELPATTSRGRHLGKIVPFSSLSAETQSHINRRISE
jgi:hypothetical protein